MEKNGVLVIGDSIVESWYVNTTSKCRVINAGLGGGGVRDAKLLLSKLDKKMGVRLSGIVIAIGVNDAQRRSFPVNYLNDWKKEYESMIGMAHQLHPKLTLSTILPVEDGMPLGANYFDRAMIEAMNTYLRQLANKKGIHLLDMNLHFSNNGKGFTVDGVHLTASSYKYFDNKMVLAMSANCI